MTKKLLLFLLFLVAFAAKAQQISGIVSDGTTNEPLPGVSVLIKGSTKGTATDANGKFSLTIPAKSGTKLTFSFVGYETQTVDVGNQTTFTVSLQTDAKILDEVVKIGYADVNRRDVLGSVSSVSAKQLADIPLSNAAEALTGRLAGVRVTTTEGSPGATIQIRIRGGGSITQDNSPIFIVDGIQVENALNFISPQDIESIDVLKDASTTEIYGARGANGVVIITTKGGKSGKTMINYNGSMGFKQIFNKLEAMSPYDYVRWQYERSRGDAALE